MADLITPSIFAKQVQVSLTTLLKDQVPNVRFNAIKCLGTLASHLKDRSASELLRKTLSSMGDDSDQEVKQLVRQMLQ